MTIATKLAAERKEKTVRDKETPSINTVIEAGMAEMKSAGLDDRKVYTACARLMRRLADRALQLERDLAAANERAEKAERERDAWMNIASADNDRATAAEAEVKAMREALMKELHIVFDGPPSHESGRFVEVETADGKSVSVGEWVQKDNYWHLVLTQKDIQGA